MPNPPPSILIHSCLLAFNASLYHATTGVPHHIPVVFSSHLHELYCRANKCGSTYKAGRGTGSLEQYACFACQSHNCPISRRECDRTTDFCYLIETHQLRRRATEDLSQLYSGDIVSGIREAPKPDAAKLPHSGAELL